LSWDLVRGVSGELWRRRGRGELGEIGEWVDVNRIDRWRREERRCDSRFSVDVGKAHGGSCHSVKKRNLMAADGVAIFTVEF